MKNKKNIGRFMVAFATTFTFASMFAMCISASAEDTDTYGISSWLDTLATNLKYIALAIAVIAIIALAIVMITGGSQGLQKGKGMAISILVGIAVLAIGTTVVSSLYDSAENSTSTSSKKSCYVISVDDIIK